MGDILDEAAAVVQCKECSWYKACVLPVRISAEDVRRQWQAAAPGMGANPSVDPSLTQLLAGMAQAAQNSMLEGCPIFINRLRQSPRLAERVKKLMQDWGGE